MSENTSSNHKPVGTVRSKGSGVLTLDVIHALSIQALPGCQRVEPQQGLALFSLVSAEADGERGHYGGLGPV